MENKILYANLNDDQRKRLFETYEKGMESGDVYIALGSDNPLIDAKIDEIMPFNWTPIEYRGRTHVLINPDGGGPVPRNKEAYQQYEFWSMPIILPIDGIWMKTRDEAAYNYILNG